MSAFSEDRAWCEVSLSVNGELKTVLTSIRWSDCWTLYDISWD